MDYIWMINSLQKHSIFFWIFCKLPTQTHVKQRLNILGLVLVFFSIEDQCHFVHQKLLFWYQYIDLLVGKKLQCLWHDQMNIQPFNP